MTYFSAVILAGVTLVSMSFETKGVYETFNSKNFHKLNSGGASAGNTGAPGENNCTACHSGTIQSGTDFNILEWTDDTENYTPGATYSMELTLDDANAKNGFQLVALKASDNTQAGTIIVTDEVRTSLIPGSGGKQYLGHKAAGNTSSQWTFNWTAPATNVGDVILYVATNKTNNNGQTSGDVIRLSQHTFAGPTFSVSLTEYDKILASLGFIYNKETALLTLSFTAQESESLHINVMNIQGKSVLAHSLGLSYPGENEKEISMPNGLPTGIYIVNFFVGNKAFSEKIIIE